MLDEKLKQYAQSDMYPFHMPGHKRKPFSFDNPYQMDITEIEGFDNLHHAQGILKDSMERAAKLYGAQRSFFLVNGSTCGILAAICAAAKKGDKILIARNCHKAVYHAAFLQELSVVYLYPESAEYGILGQITPEAVAEALERQLHPLGQNLTGQRQTDLQVFKGQSRIAAVVITSPTYDGIVSDIRGISKVVHSYGIPLIVDEAHGAHFGLYEGFPENAVQLGADAVILSLHKTLPAFTQTALLHLCSQRISAERIGKYLAIFESSSPSYILMAGIEKCLRFVTEEGEKAFREFHQRLKNFQDAVSDLQALKVLRQQDFDRKAAYDFDLSKLLIVTEIEGYSGKMLQEELREEFHLELEMAAGNYALAMTSVCDTDEGFNRLSEALHNIDKRLRALEHPPENQGKTVIVPEALYKGNPKIMEIHEADARPVRAADLREAAGAVSADYVSIYPPGIPVLVPGEQIAEERLKQISACIQCGLIVEGLPASNRINIVI